MGIPTVGFNGMNLATSNALHWVKRYAEQLQSFAPNWKLCASKNAGQEKTIRLLMDNGFGVCACPMTAVAPGGPRPVLPYLEASGLAGVDFDTARMLGRAADGHMHYEGVQEVREALLSACFGKVEPTCG